MRASFSRYDYLKITNDANETFGMHCGDRTGRTVTVTGNQVLMTFHSDQSVQMKGFALTLTTTPIGEYNRSASGLLKFQMAAVFFCLFFIKLSDSRFD